MNGSRGPKIALVAIGLGRVQRGFERYFTDLFQVLRDELDITLYKSRGANGAQESVPPLLQTATAVARRLPLAKAIGTREYNRDCIAYGLTLLPDLLRKRYDVVHCIDPPLAHVLARLQRTIPFRSRLLFTEGCVMPVHYYPPVAHIHHVAPGSLQLAQDAGFAADRMTLVPCGIHSERFATSLDRAQLRKKYSVAENTFVVLAVSAVKREHKRVDYIVEEVSKLKGDVLLWIDGNPEDAAVVELARRRVGERCRITHVDSADIPELYRLSDVLVHASLTEAFGLVLVEAAASGLMVLAHDSPHFRWLLQEHECVVDMSTPGALSTRLRDLMHQGKPSEDSLRERATSARRRFDWACLRDAYVSMYCQVAEYRSPAALQLQEIPS